MTHPRTPLSGIFTNRKTLQRYATATYSFAASPERSMPTISFERTPATVAAAAAAVSLGDDGKARHATESWQSHLVWRRIESLQRVRTNLPRNREKQ